MSLELRDRVVNSIQTKEPVYYSRPPRQGDSLINRWVYSYILRKLSQETDLDYSSLNLRSYPYGNGLRKDYADFGHYKYTDYNLLDITKKGIVAHQLQIVGSMVEVEVTEEDYGLVPQPDAADFDPWFGFDKTEVINKGDILRENIRLGVSRLVVIAQFGSQAEKRFSDKQAQELAQFVKENDPNSYVAVATDKTVLRKSLPKPWHRITRPPSFYAFPYTTNEFKKQLQGEDYGKAVDQVISDRDISTFCKWFYNADLLIATDSFGSWLGCGAKSLRRDRNGRLEPTDAVILYTIANPDIWKIPGVTRVVSHGLEYQRIFSSPNFDFLSYKQYYFVKPWADSILSNDPRRAITHEDIELVKDKIKCVL